MTGAAGPTTPDEPVDSGASAYDTRTVVLSLVAGVFFGGVGGGVAFPTLPRLGTVLGFSALVVGAILAINRFTRMVMNTPAGSILDSYGTRRPMIVGFIVQGVSPFGYVLGLTHGLSSEVSAAIFLLSRAMWGVGSAFVFVGAFATITHVTTRENRGKWTGYMRGGQSLGFPTGLVVGALMADTFGFAAAFFVAGVAGVFAAVVAFVVLPDVTPDVGRSNRIRDVPALVTADLRVLTVGVVNFVVRLLFVGVLLSTVVEFAAANDIQVGFLSATGVSGLVMAASVLCSSATTLVVGAASDRVPNRALISVPALVLIGSGFGLLAFVPTLPGTLLGVSLVGVGVAGTNLPLLAFLGDISPADDVGKLGGVYNVFGDFGSTVGPLVALPFAVAYGFELEYLCCVGLVVVAALLVAGTLLGDASPAPLPSSADD